MTLTPANKTSNLFSPYLTGGSNYSLMARIQKKRPVRETITYPKVIVTDNTDSCRNSALPCEHVLMCGHLVTTALPNEPCAPNCHHVADGRDMLDWRQGNQKTPRTKNGKQISESDFYCDACVEARLELCIGVELSSAESEELRAKLRTLEAENLKKNTDFRKCYIALKVTSVPCHSEGTMSSRYNPRKEHHPFDTAVPQSGENMFEDVDSNAVEAQNSDAITDSKPTYMIKDVDLPLDYHHTRAPPAVTETSGSSVGDTYSSTTEHTRNNQAACHSKTSKKYKIGPAIGSCKDDSAKVGSRILKRKRVVVDEDDSEEDGEIVEQPAKRRRIAPVTRSLSRQQTKRT
jgi:hypothetical protein